MQEEYLEMRGKELLIDGIVVAEVTNLDDAIAISDRVSNYVAELQRKNEELLNKLRAANATISNHLGDEDHDEDICDQTSEPRSQCNCFECWPEGQESDNVDHDY